MAYEIALVDCDSFFVSCEQLMDPKLLGKPVCVMSNNDGCVVARSKEAKALGVKMAMPVFQARKLYPQVIYISSNLGLYGEISARLMRFLTGFSPVVEVYSIDEAFIDLTGLRKFYRKPFVEIIADIRQSVKDEVGIPVSIGISSTKTLAKLATERAKKNEGIYRIGFRAVNDELKKTDLIDIWGMGSNTVALLNKYGIYNAYSFTLQDDVWIKKVLGKKGLELKLELTGTSISPVSNREVLPKSIQKTSSFSKFTSDENYIKRSLYYHAHSACKKLRRLGMKTSTIGIMLRTKDFYIVFNKHVLGSASDFEFDIYKAIDKLFYQTYMSGVVYRSSGVILENLCSVNKNQLSLFDSQEQLVKNQKLSQAWDKLEDKYGRNVIRTGDIL